MQTFTFILAAIAAYIIKPIYFGPVERMDAVLIGVFMGCYIVISIVLAPFGGSSKSNE